MAKIIVTWKNKRNEVVYLKDESIINDFVDFLKLTPKEKKKVDAGVYEKEDVGRFMINFNDVKKIDSDSEEGLGVYFG